MRKLNRSSPWGRLTRGAVLGAGVLLLAGCATGYSFVQPDIVGSGGYYTSESAYAGAGYYDYYATGPYYPGTSGWGYYNGSLPYSNPYGWYGGGYGYGSSVTFNLGFSNVWGFPGYWGPWYSSRYPGWGCQGWYGCGGWRHQGHHDRHDHAGDQPKPWLKPDHPPIPPVAPVTGSASLAVRPPRPVVRRPVEDFAGRRPLQSATFAPHEFMRAPVRRPVETGIGAMPVRRAYVPPRPNESAIGAVRIRRGQVPPRPSEAGFSYRREASVTQSAPPTPRPVSRPAFQSRTPPPVRATVPPSRNRHTRTEVQ